MNVTRMNKFLGMTWEKLEHEIFTPEEIEKMELGEKIKKLRKGRYTQEELADKIGVHTGQQHLLFS